MKKWTYSIVALAFLSLCQASYGSDDVIGSTVPSSEAFKEKVNEETDKGTTSKNKNWFEQFNLEAREAPTSTPIEKDDDDLTSFFEWAKEDVKGCGKEKDECD